MPNPPGSPPQLRTPPASALDGTLLPVSHENGSLGPLAWQASEIYDVAVTGAGLAGSTLAIALTQGGARVALIGPDDSRADDTRTTALLAPSVAWLATLGIWAGCSAYAAPLIRLQIVDATRRVLRAPSVTFDARESGAAAFGQNVPNTILGATLAAALPVSAARFRPALTELQMTAGAITLTLADGQRLAARLLVGADGRNSAVARLAGIRQRRNTSGQTAIATRLTAERPHDGSCLELHRAGGPLTLVPLPGNALSLVWVEQADAAAALMALDNASFLAALERATARSFGQLTALGPRRAFPIETLMAERLTAPRVWLAGEAAHVVPPTGAQGLNLSLADGMAATRLILEALATNDDPGGTELGLRYTQARRGDTALRASASVALNAAMVSSSPAAALLRGAGLTALAGSGLLRRIAMRAGTGG